jgi:hypothetical protein
VDIRELDRSWTDISLMEVAADDGDGDGDSLELDLCSVDFEDEDVFQGPTRTSTIRGRVADVSFSTFERETGGPCKNGGQTQSMSLVGVRERYTHRVPLPLSSLLLLLHRGWCLRH